MSRQSVEDDPVCDHVRVRQNQWAQEIPDVNTIGMAVLGRARWLTLRVRPAIEAELAKHGLDTGEFDVLASLLRSGPPYRLRPTELFKSLMISSGGLTDRLNRLEDAGLIIRRPCSQDARSILVELTEGGRSRAEASFIDDMRVEAEMLRALDEHELETVAHLLAKLCRSLEGVNDFDSMASPARATY